MAKTVPCEGAVRCRGKFVAKCYGYDRAALYAAHKDGLYVPCQEGEEEELVEDPNEEVGGVACHPDRGKVCHGEALPWPTLQGHVGIGVPPGCIFVVRKGLYGGVARVAPEDEGVAQVVEWRQVGDDAAVTDFVRLRRMYLVLDDPKKEGKAHVTRCENCPLHLALTPALTSYRARLSRSNWVL